MIIVTSHADLIKLVLAHYLGVHLDLFQRIAIAPASVSILNLMPNGMVQVLRLNDDGPIQAPPAPKKKKSKKKKKLAAQRKKLSDEEE
jgi:probable phosphoglycerate mutase